MTHSPDSSRRPRAHDREHFVEPGLRPSNSGPLPPGRIFAGLILLIVGFTAIVFGGSDAVGQTFLISGSILVVAALCMFRAFRFGFHRRTEDHDIRKLYGTRRT